MFQNHSFVKINLFCCLFILLFNSCGTISQNINDKKGWIEIDRINLKYDEDFLEKGVFFTEDDDYEKTFDIFINFIKNAHLVRISSEINLKNNYHHQLIIYRKQDGTEYINFDIYKLEIVYRNYSISYDIINDSRRGAANYGDKYRFFNLYNEPLDSFYLNVDAEMRIIYNNLSKSNDPLVNGQAFAIKYCLDNKFRRFFP
jgi:hypothetical protein